jgi:hypothetical protein
LKPKTSMQKQKQKQKRETDFSRIWQKEKTILSRVSRLMLFCPQQFQVQ